MKNHLTAVIEELQPLGDVYLRDAIKYDADGVEVPLDYPYWIVWPADGRPDKETALTGETADLTAVIAVTSVASTPQGAQIAAENARRNLGWLRTQQLNVPGQVTLIRWEGQVGGGIDRDITLPGTNRNPAYEVDYYRLNSTPDQQL